LKEYPPARIKDKMDDVTWKHKRWLTEFQDRQTELGELMDDKTRELEDKKLRFTEKCAKSRAQVREVTEGDYGEEAMAMALEGTLREEDLEEMKLTKAELSRKEKKTLKAKPKWAMTKEQNEDVEVPKSLHPFLHRL
jgi:hypothetical protein